METYFWKEERIKRFTKTQTYLISVIKDEILF